MSARQTDDLRMLEIYRLIIDTQRRIKALGLTKERVVSPQTYVDSILVDTLYMNVYRILEEATNLDFETQFAYSQVPWNAVRGMRNRFAHDYGSVDAAIVWETIERGFPTLFTMAESYLDERGLSPADIKESFGDL